MAEIYLVQQRKTTEENIREVILSRINLLKKNKKFFISDYDLKRVLDKVVRDILYINNEILFEDPYNRIFLVTIKSPARLDKGKTYYALFFIRDNKINTFCPRELAEVFGGEVKEFSNFTLFSSSAIGMSRVSDATYSLSEFFKEVGGCDVQFIYPLI